MKTIKYFAMAALAICLSACGGKKDSEIVLKPAETAVSGDMEGCFTVVDKEYKATGDIQKLITVEIERTSQDLPFELGDRELWSFGTSGASANVQVGFGIEFLDADGNVLSKVSANGAGLLGSYDSDEAVALVKLKTGKKGTIRFEVPDDAKEAVSFRITTAFREGEGSDDSEMGVSDESMSSDDNMGDESLSSSSGSEDWDALLDSYDEYVTKYISFAKKAAKGDMSAMAEYPSLLEKAKEFSDKMSGAQGEMSTAQWARYMKITSKMTKAATGMK